MKKLEFHTQKDIEDPKKAFSYLINNLQESILTWDFFVDWEKIRKKVADVEEELNLLNVLIGKDDTEEKFIELVKKYPRIKKALSLLIAVRGNKLKDVYLVNKDDIGQDIDKWHTELKRDYFKVNRDIDERTKKELLKFYKDSGLKEVLEEKDIKNVEDYYFGVEVGMDTNARKNRTGDAMEAVVHEYLLPQFPQLLEQASLGDVKKEWGIEIFFEGISPQKKFDFAVLSESKKVFLIEVNYYSGGGSKLSAVAGHYKDYERFINEGETSFIWITDGLGWKTAKNDLEDTFLNNDYVFSLKMISENILNEVIK
jgi:type II restriction enzyme